MTLPLLKLSPSGLRAARRANVTTQEDGHPPAKLCHKNCGTVPAGVWARQVPYNEPPPFHHRAGMDRGNARGNHLKHSSHSLAREIKGGIRRPSIKSTPPATGIMLRRCRVDTPRLPPECSPQTEHGGKGAPGGTLKHTEVCRSRTAYRSLIFDRSPPPA